MKKLILAFLVITLSTAHAASFIRIKDQRFIRGEKQYNFMGTNFWQGMNLPHALIVRELDAMKKSGITQLRILGLSEGPNDQPYRVVPAAQVAPGIYDENVLKGLDILLSEIQKREMTAVLCLNNFWPWSGGMGQWVSWFEGSSIPYPPPHPGGNWGAYQEYATGFYLLPEAMQAARESIKKIITRINSVTGSSYMDDPTIMSWELANEPRGGKHREAFLNWVSAEARFIKSIDKNHLVTLGSEGGTLNAADAGNDFIEDHSIPEIDYTTIHIWMENWGVYEPKNSKETLPKAIEAMKSYVEKHVEKARILKKPIIIEEFGLARDHRSMDPDSKTTSRDLYFEAVFQLALEHMKKDGIISGINFWAWSGESRPKFPFGGLWRPGDQLIGDPPHEEQGWYGVYGSDTSTLKVIEKFAIETQKLN